MPSLWRHWGLLRLDNVRSDCDVLYHLQTQVLDTNPTPLLSQRQNVQEGVDQFLQKRGDHKRRQSSHNKVRLQLSPLPAPSHLHHHGHLCQALMDQYFQQLNDCKPCGDNLCGRYPYHRHYCGIPGGHKYFTARSVVRGHSNFSLNYDRIW